MRPWKCEKLSNMSNLLRMMSLPSSRSVACGLMHKSGFASIAGNRFPVQGAHLQALPHRLRRRLGCRRAVTSTPRTGRRSRSRSTRQADKRLSWWGTVHARCAVHWQAVVMGGRVGCGARPGGWVGARPGPPPAPLCRRGCVNEGPLPTELGAFSVPCPTTTAQGGSGTHPVHPTHRSPS